MRITDGEATGTIANADPLPKAWLARIGRTIGGQVVDALRTRFDGGGDSHATLGGQRIGAGAVPDEAGTGPAPPDGRDREESGGETRTMTVEELLPGTAFHLASERKAGGPVVAAWGRFASTSFKGESDAVTMDGQIATGFLGADVEWERALAGVMVSHSIGVGSWHGEGGGRIESVLTGLYPYGRLALNERVSVWGVAGLGAGGVTVRHDERDAMAADVTLRMGAVGIAGRVLDSADGLGVRLRSEAMWVGMASGAAEGLEASESDVRRLRLVVEGERAIMLGAGATFTPSAEAGLRLDGGDAETGTGVELGARARYAVGRLAVEGAVRALVVHEDRGYEEWGASGTVRLDPDASGRGLSLSLSSVWGTAESGVERLWQTPEAVRGSRVSWPTASSCHARPPW